MRSSGIADAPAGPACPCGSTNSSRSQRIIDLVSTDLKGALGELLDMLASRFSDLNRDALLRGLMQRENTMTTYLGLGVALPHVRVKMRRRYLLAIGRSQAGIRYDGLKDNERLHLVIMLIADEGARDYLQVLASLARLVKEPEFVHSLIQAPDLRIFHGRLITALGGIAARPAQLQQNRINRIMFREAERVARGLRLLRDHGVRRHLPRRHRGGPLVRRDEDHPGHAESHRHRGGAHGRSPRRSRCARSPASGWPSCAARCLSP